MAIQVICDTREHFDFEKIAAQVLKDHGIDVMYRPKQNDQSDELSSVFQTSIADLVFIDHRTRNVLCLVEHKHVNDFRQSLQPGHLQSKRLTDQLSRMQGAGVPRLILLLTGPYHATDDALKKALLTKTIMLQSNPEHPVQVVRIDTLDHMPLFVARVVQSLINKTEKEVNEAPNFHTLMVAVRKTQTDTPEKIYQTLLQLIPGLSAKSAKEIYRNYPTIGKLRSACRKDPHAVSKLKLQGRHLNKRSAAILCDFLKTTDADESPK